MKRRLLTITLIGIIATVSVVKAQTYDPLAVQRINDLITKNGLVATPDAPETWNFAKWNYEVPKQIIEINLEHTNLTGAVSFEGLSTLQRLTCYHSNYLTELDVTDCTELIWLSCYDNLLSEIDLSNCSELRWLFCDYNYLTELDVTNYNICTVDTTAFLSSI